MKLYVSNRAPNPRRVLWAMAEKGVDDIEIVNLDLMKDEHKRPDLVARFGVAGVPALELDDGAVLTESVAIVRYLESLYPEPNMFGRDAREAAFIEMWTRRAEIMVATPLMEAVRHFHPALAVLENQVPEVGQAMRAQGEGNLALFDRRLADHEFIAGDRITMADIILACAIDFVRLIKIRPPEDLVNLQRWRVAMMERPGAKAGT